jgi:hypothetical protein
VYLETILSRLRAPCIRPSFTPAISTPSTTWRWRLLTNHPRKIVALEGFGIEIVGQQPVDG